MKNIFDPGEISLVANYIREGEVVAIPTETVYGLAADIHQGNAIKQIFTLKNRPTNHPLIIHISDIAQLYEYAINVPDYVITLAKYFWPGPLTMVLPKSNLVSNLVTGNQSTVAIRMPNHPICLELIKSVGKPLAAPSANLFGKISPTQAKHVISEFQGKVKVLDGGTSIVGIESTIIDSTNQDFCSILRPGMISINDIQEVLISAGIRCLENGNKAVSGTLKHHYAPSKPNFLFENLNELLEICDFYQNSVYVLSLKNTFVQLGLAGTQMPLQPNQYAQNIYEQLRIADESLSKAIAIELPPISVEWRAIIDRLTKSSSKSMELLRTSTHA